MKKEDESELEKAKEYFVRLAKMHTKLAEEKTEWAEDNIRQANYCKLAIKLIDQEMKK